MKRLPHVIALSLASLSLILSGSGARAASNCVPIVVFSGTPPVPLAPPPEYALCGQAQPPGTLPVVDQIDSRLIQPGSTHVDIGYTRSYGPGSKVTARLNGLGFNNKTIDIPWNDGPPNFGSYIAGPYLIPNGPVVTGTLTVTITRPNGTTEASTWRVAP